MVKKIFKKLKIFWVWEEKDYKEVELEDYEEIDEFDDNYDDSETRVFEEKNLWQIALDILDDWDRVLILAPVAGIELKDIDLAFFNQVLTISWVRKKPDFYNDDVFVKNSECYWGKFSRKIILPENLDFENIKASMENNLLLVTIPKLHFSNHNIKIDKIY